jgi:hypothetical protein
MARAWWRTALTVAVGAVLGVSPAHSAAANWSFSDAGTGRAKARVLAAPGSVTATCVNLTSIGVSWTATDLTPNVDSYQVARSSNGGTSWTNRGAPIAATTSTSYAYTDGGLGVGSYVYRVTAAKANWNKASENSNPRTVTALVCS